MSSDTNRSWSAAIVHQVSPLKLGKREGVGVARTRGGLGVAPRASQTLARPKKRLIRAWSVVLESAIAFSIAWQSTSGSLPFKSMARRASAWLLASSSSSAARKQASAAAKSPVFSWRLPYVTLARASCGCDLNACWM